jgi:glyoxalase-like protein
MKPLARTYLASIALFSAACSCQTPQSPGFVQTSAVIGIDHVPLAVVDLEQASSTYRKLGFALKPGRPHADGIRNAHVKFPDGSGIELITASRAYDELSTRYLAALSIGEGPAFISFHTRSSSDLARALSTARFTFTKTAGAVTLSEPSLNYIFFVRDNRSPTDTPADFAHPNIATAMVSVWIADDTSSTLRRLLEALGAVMSDRTVRVPDDTPAKVATVDNGEIILLPASRRLLKDRPVVGASFRVASLEPIARLLASNDIPMISKTAAPESRAIFVPPSAAHGIWLEFRELK